MFVFVCDDSSLPVAVRVSKTRECKVAYYWSFPKKKIKILLFLGHRSLIKNKTQTAVINILNLFILIMT